MSAPILYALAVVGIFYALIVAQIVKAAIGIWREDCKQRRYQQALASARLLAWTLESQYAMPAVEPNREPKP